MSNVIDFPIYREMKKALDHETTADKLVDDALADLEAAVSLLCRPEHVPTIYDKYGFAEIQDAISKLRSLNQNLLVYWSSGLNE